MPGRVHVAVFLKPSGKNTLRIDASFNSRLLRTRNTTGKVFDILSARCQASQLKPEKTGSLGIASCNFHNCLTTNIVEKINK